MPLFLRLTRFWQRPTRHLLLSQIKSQSLAAPNSLRENHRMLRKIIYGVLFLSFFGLLAAGAFLTWGYYYITRDLPELSSTEDYRPSSVTFVYADDGSLVAEFFNERRYPVKLSEVPQMVRNCFIAAEDASFYKHPGLDPISILRAVVKNLQKGSAKQGGSTITQQVVKNLLLTPEKKLTRKIKEAILSYRLENRLSKDEILELYLNQIFFGNTAYGIRAAAKTYYHKELSELTLAEASILAGLPKAPSTFSPILNKEGSKRRQRYVLDQMRKAGFITEEEKEAALKEKVQVHVASQENVFDAPYFVSEVRRVFQDKWREYDLDRDGLHIYTSLNRPANAFATKALRDGLRSVDKRRGWRGPIGSVKGPDREEYKKLYSPFLRGELKRGEPYPALVLEVSRAKGTAKVMVGEQEGVVKLSDAGWARKMLDKLDRVRFSKPEDVLKVGDIIEVAIPEKSTEGADGKSLPPEESPFQSLKLSQSPEVEGAVVLIDPNSGKVAAMVGGYSYQRSVFNRATQSLRQPGSAFKPIVYLAAVDGFQYTPSTIVHDQPRTFRVGDTVWTPGNFDEKFLGDITLRTALEKSRNLVSVDIVSRIGLNAVIQYARRLGLESPMGRNLSIALGSSEVTPLELTRAYGVFAAKGVLFDTVLVTKIVDRNGNVLFDYETEKLNHAKQVINENSAFIMANVMKGVIQSGTATVIKPINRPVAGKTGTTNDFMDTWFIGYTPQWVAGVWVGFDQKKEIGPKETGGKVSAPIWLNFMQPFLDYMDKVNYENLVEEAKADAERLGIDYLAPEPLQPLDFAVPDGVDPFWVNKASGRLADPGSDGAILEYFLRGTEPPRYVPEEEETTESYLESPEL